jgi:NitT/TauT family transport system substrate-binding protein
VRGAVAALAVLLAGCHGPAPRADAPPLKHLRVTLRPVLSNAVMLITREAGYFREQGLDVEFVGAGHNRDSFPSLIDGKVDVLTSTVVPAYFNAIAGGAHVKIVAELGRLAPGGCTYAALVTRKTLLKQGRLLAPAPPGRLKVGLRRGSASDFLLEKAVQAEGLGPDRYEIDFLPAAVEVEALRKGAVDVVLGNAGGVEQLLLDGTAAVWRTGQEMLPDFPFLVVLYGPSLLQDDPDAGRRFMSAYLQGVAQYNEGRTERNLRILEGRSGLDRQELAASCWIPIADDARVETRWLVEFQAWARAQGLVSRELDLSEFWDPRFLDAAALQPPTGELADRP